MAVVNTKSTAITNADAAGTGALTLNAAGVVKAQTYTVYGHCAVASGDDNNSIYRFVRVPSNARIISIMRFNDAITGATDWNFGLYQTAANGGADADENLFADAVDINAGTVAGVEQRFTTSNITTCNQRVWELLGLSADSKRDYDICGTAIAVGSADGDVVLRVTYSVD
ncbi:MAG: hypothetical protein AB7P35_17715 [Hyphomonadaceae bacterium]